MSPLVSVIIPTVRRPHLVTRAINSVLAQTFEDFEIIIIIDGEDIQTREALSNISDGRVRVVQNATSLGAGMARNVGIEIAAGPWIAFLDDDDEWLPRKLEKQLSVAGIPEQPIIVSCLSYIATPRARYVWPRKVYDNLIPFDEYLFDRRSAFAGDTFLPTPSVLMPRAFFSSFKFPPQRLHEDWDLWLRAIKIGNCRVTTVLEPLLVVYMEDERESLGRSVAWKESLEWADRNRALIGRRAYAGFCLTVLAPQVSANGEYCAFFRLLLSAFRAGSPTITHLFVYFAFGLVPLQWRRRIRALCSVPKSKLSSSQLHR